MPQVAAPIMPSSVTAMPKCATAVPQTERGKPMARVRTVASGARNSAVRSTRSTSAPAITKNATPTPNGARTDCPPWIAKVAAIATRPMPNAAISRCATPYRSPRFQASSGPNGITHISATNSGPNVMLKNGAPTEILAPVSPSRANGYSVPTNTVRQAVVRKRLLNTSAPSREIGANRPPCLSIGPRQANNARLPPMNSTRMIRMNTPRVGSLAKECTEVSTPERTRKVPISDSEKVRIASRIVHIFNELRFSITTAECNNAVPVSHGMKEAFSTGSQNQKPPQPSV